MAEYRTEHYKLEADCSSASFLNNFYYFDTGRFRQQKHVLLPAIDKVIFNPPATIVMWSDGTKTVVKARKGKKKAETDEFSEEVGLAMAVAKRYFGSRSAFVKAIEGGKRPMGETSAPKRTLADFVEEINDAIKVPKKSAKKG